MDLFPGGAVPGGPVSRWSCARWTCFQVELCQVDLFPGGAVPGGPVSRWSCASDLTMDTPAATPPGAWRCKVNAGAGWTGVVML